MGTSDTPHPVPGCGCAQTASDLVGILSFSEKVTKKLASVGSLFVLIMCGCLLLVCLSAHLRSGDFTSFSFAKTGKSIKLRAEIINFMEAEDDPKKRRLSKLNPVCSQPCSVHFSNGAVRVTVITQLARV